jgi:hypothetical protein
MNNNFLHNLSKHSATSFIAIIWSIGGLGLLFYIVSGRASSDGNLQTQIAQGLFGLLMLVLGYYFGSSKKHSDGTTEGTTTADIQATITTSPTDTAKP